jgi:hypothetical protein
MQTRDLRAKAMVRKGEARGEVEGKRVSEVFGREEEK